MIKKLKKLSLVLVVFLASFSVFATTYTSQYPPEQNGTYVKATGYQSSYYPYNITDPTKSLTGSYGGTEWVSANTEVNPRFHIDLGSAKIIKRIYYENHHNSGGETNAGSKDFTFYGSNTSTAFDDVTPGHNTNWTQLTVDDSTFDEHVAADTADPKYVLVTNSTAYRYYAFEISSKWSGTTWVKGQLRRIELQTENSTNTFIPKIIFF